MIRPRRPVSSFLIALACLVAARIEKAAAVEFHVVVPGWNPGVAGEEVDGLLAKAGMKIDGDSPSSADAVLLDHRSLEALASGGDAFVSALEAAVERGAALVVTGEASAALPASEKLTRLLGRKLADDGERSKNSAGLTLEVPDQSHPITQCVTGLYFGKAPALCESGKGVIELARVAGAGSHGPCVFWTRREESGSVVVLSLGIARERGGATGTRSTAKDDAAARRERTALAFLAARSVEWAAGRTVTVKIPEAMPLAVERLGPGDAGLLPGVPAADGFFRGRQIAPVMGYQAADWLERKDREETEQPERVLDALAIAEGSTVADIGAGTGYFSFRMARRVGPKGKVLASDLQKEMIQLLSDRIAKDGVKNVEPILATETDPRLPENAVDLALLVDVYHELAKPASVLAALRKSLKTGSSDVKPGRLVLIEYRGDDPMVAIKPLHRTTVQQVRAEIEPVGFKLVELKGFLPHQNILVFEKSQPLVNAEK